MVCVNAGFEFVAALLFHCIPERMTDFLFPGDRLQLQNDRLTFGGGAGITTNAMKYARPPIDDFRIFKYTSTWQAFGSIVVLVLHFLSPVLTLRYQALINTLSPPLWIALFFSCS